MKINKQYQKKSEYSFSYGNKSLLLSFIIVGILFIAILTRNSNIILLNIFFIVYLFTGVIQAPSNEEISLSADRSVCKIKKEDCFSVEVRLKIVNNGNKNICIITADPYYEAMKITEGSLKLSTALAPREQTELSYTFESLRGGYHWNDLYVKVSDPFGCFILNTKIKAEAEIFIQPQYKKYRAFQIRPWKIMSSPGCIPGNTSGHGTDFRGIREYHPGDPLKTLDWRLTAKHPHKFFTKEFDEEKTADIMFIIDSRRDLELVAEDKSLFEMEINYTASISDMFLHQGHRVGLSITGKNQLRVMPGYGKKQLHRILNCLAQAKTSNENSYNGLENLSIKHFSSKVIIFVFSPFHYHDITFYRTLRSHGFQVVLICPDSFDFALQEFDFYKKRNNSMSIRAAKIERKLNLSLLSQLSISVINWKVSQSLIPLVKSALYKHIPIRKL